ncbi:MAG: aspartyl-phosphate phosphatase Spo0E family protein [Acidaminobacteraceae bacterium]
MTNRKISELIMNIEKMRRELNELVTLKEILDPQIIEKSQELDKLIYDYGLQKSCFSKK